MDEKPQQNEQAKGQDATTTKAKQKTNGSSSNTPRKRVSQACDRCRSRKDKCDGKKPVCSTCAAQDQVCSYDPATKKRGLPEGYVRGLEKLWGLTIREVDEIEDNILGILSGGPDTRSVDNLAAVWNDREGSETLLETWRKSRIARELERLLPILDSVEEKPGKRKRPEPGPSRNEGVAEAPPPIPRPIVAEHRGLAEDFYNNQDDLLAIHPHLRRRMVDVLPSPPEEPKIASDLLSLPSRTWHLLDVFFSYTHCWLPIVEKHDVLRVSYQYTQRGLHVSPSLPGSGDHATLWAILAYADWQNNAIGKKDSLDDPQWTVDSLYRQARNLIPTEEGIYELGHVQALLILALLNMGRNYWNRAWILIGQAVRIAINLGLDNGSKDNPSQYPSTDKKSRSQHVFLGCFALDTLIACRLGRKPQLRKEDADRVGSIEEDGLDEWNPWLDCLSVRRYTPEGPHGPTAVLSTFNQLILLLKILNSVACDVSTGNGKLETCQELLNDLDSWGQVLPTLFTSLKPPLLPHRYHLHLAHVSTIAVVYSHISNFSKQMKIPDSTIAETFATTAGQTMWLLLRQSEGFGLLIVPPTYDYFSKIACESAYKVPDRVSDENLTFHEWEINIERCLTEMDKVWPTFEALSSSLSAKVMANSYQYQTPRVLVHRSESFDSPHHIPTHTKQPSVSDGVYNFSGNLTHPSISTRDFAGQSNSAFSHPQYDPLLNLATSATLHSIEDASPSWPEQHPTQNLFVEQPSADQLRFPDGSMGSDVDGDSMFNDFATLDAMEWYVIVYFPILPSPIPHSLNAPTIHSPLTYPHRTQNWDQSLLNLGFTDSDTHNMNQDFYALTRDPDPHYSNNLVQQLLTNNTEHLLTSNTDGGGGMDGGRGMVFGQEGNRGIEFANPQHVEASQILQALAGARGSGVG